MAFVQKKIRSSREDIRKEQHRSLFVWSILICFFILIFLYRSISSIGSMIVVSGDYTLDKGVSVSTLPQSLDLDISNWKYKLWIRYFAPKIENLQA